MNICYPIHGTYDTFEMNPLESYYTIDFVKKRTKFPDTLLRNSNALKTRVFAFYRMDTLLVYSRVVVATSIPIQNYEISIEPGQPWEMEVC
jgi:hypothetical protein